MANVLILGATSAIAAEVARIYSARGDRLHLVGRSRTKLLEVAASCVDSPAVTFATADFEHEDAEAVIREALAALGNIDVALIAHGDLGDQLASESDFAEAERILRINFTSAVALLIPIANHFEHQRRGRVGVITSVAGVRGRPRNYTYGAAKAGLNTYLQGLRSRLYRYGVTVTSLKLGPVDTPMTAHHEKNVWFASPGPVARAIVAAVERGAREPYIPWIWALIMPLVRWTPEPIFQRVKFLSGR
jgi:decaprenylphospho-beta-D-erythro-pentofuranosid-2-ulose 2-reductase